MLYLNGEIAAAYWQGHWHYAAYLGDVLVWDGLHRKRGEARNAIVFTTTAAGVTALAVPAAAAAQLRVLSSAEGKEMPFVVGQGDGALAFHTSAEGGTADVGTAQGTENLMLYSSADGKAVLVEKNLLYELLTLTSSGSAVPVDSGTSKAGEALTVTQSSEGIAAGTVPAEGSGEANFAGTGEGVSVAAGSGAATEPLTLENSAAPAAAMLGAGLSALGLHLASRAEAGAYSGPSEWESPSQKNNLLDVEQVYSAVLNGGLLEVE